MERQVGQADLRHSPDGEQHEPRDQRRREDGAGQESQRHEPRRTHRQHGQPASGDGGTGGRRPDGDGGKRGIGTQQLQYGAVQGNLDDHEGNTTAHITASERTSWNGKSGKAVSFTVTLTAAGWSGNAQTVSNSKFVTSGYAYTVCPAGDSFAGYAEAVIYADDVTTAGKMTFHCNEAPTANLTVNILRTEATA